METAYGRFEQYLALCRGVEIELQLGGRSGKATHNSVWPGSSREECASVTDSRLQGLVASL